ncbi:hypothetical protein RYX36_014767 [Vicia faba]
MASRVIFEGDFKKKKQFHLLILLMLLQLRFHLFSLTTMKFHATKKNYSIKQFASTKSNTPQSNGTSEISRFKEELFNFKGFRGDFTRLRLNESIGVRWLSQSAADTAKKDEAESAGIGRSKKKLLWRNLTNVKAKAVMEKRPQES